VSMFPQADLSRIGSIRDLGVLSGRPEVPMNRGFHIKQKQTRSCSLRPDPPKR
jgi:hypothetical protein